MIQIIGGVVVLGAIGGLWQLKEIIEKRRKDKGKER